VNKDFRKLPGWLNLLHLPTLPPILTAGHRVVKNKWL